MAAAVIRKEELDYRDAAQPATGLRIAKIVGPERGSAHTETGVAELAPGGEVPGHRHSFEESFYVLSGEAEATIGSSSYRLRPGDFAVVPIGVPHALHNTTGSIFRRYIAHAPPAHHVLPGSGTIPSDEVDIPSGSSPLEPGPAARWVGHFSDEHLPAPGPLALPGFRAPTARGVSTWMLIDSLVGAVHHTMFIVEYQPGASPHPAGDHFHPFEETFHFVSGSAVAYLEGAEYEVEEGDTVFAGVGAVHGFATRGDEPVRWIEVQAPQPPPSGGFIVPSEWKRLES